MKKNVKVYTMMMINSLYHFTNNNNSNSVNYNKQHTHIFVLLCVEFFF